MGSYEKLAEYFDKITRPRTNYKKEAENIHELFQDFGVKTVLDLACGTGSHILELGMLGYECTGYDLECNMIEVAKKKALMKGLHINYKQSDMRQYQANQKFDSILILYALGFLEGEDEFVHLLTEIRKSMDNGGVFIFNTLNKDYEAEEKDRNTMNQPSMDILSNTDQLKIVRVNKTENEYEKEKWIHTYLIDNGKELIIESLNQVYSMYSIKQLRQLLSGSGFEIIKVQYHDIHKLRKWDMLVTAKAV